jgi:hypothetical protein
MFCSRGPRRGNGTPYWDWLALALDRPFRAWLAGPIVGVEVHYAHGSRACRRSITDGGMPCAFCESQMPTTWRGYVPLWDESGIRCVTLIGARYLPLAQTIPLLAPVHVTRTKRQGCPIKVEAHDWTTAFPPVTEAEKGSQDLRAWLLRLWKDKELAKWIAAHPDTQPAPVELTPPKRVTKAERAATVNAAFAESVAKRAQGTLPGVESAADVIAHLPSLNGRGKHK